MALDLFFDGFDHQNSYTDLASGNKWSGTNNGVTDVTIDPATFRFSGKSLLLTPGGGAFKNTPGAETTMYLGAAMTYTAGAAPQIIMFGSASQSGQNVSLTVDQVNSRLQLRSGSPTGAVLCSTSNGTFEPATWYYVELKIVFSATVGAVVIYIDGSSAATASSANTAPSGTASCSSYALLNDAAGTQPCWFDDHYFHNGGGSAPYNAALGDVRIETLFPNANSSVAFTPLTGSNFSEVDETAMDGDTSYNFSSTVNQTDLFAHPNLSTSPTTIFAAAVTSAFRQESASTRALQNKVKSSTATATGGATVPGTAYQYQQDIFLVDPNTSSAWADAGINAATFGYLLEA